MNRKNTQKLLKKYPKLFVQHKLPITQSAMGWLFQHGDGWCELLDCVCDWLSFQIKENNMPPVEFTTVKEKFGTLQIYYVGGNEETSSVISFVSWMSMKICENCGSVDDVQSTKGYITYFCKKCRKRRAL